MLRAFLLGVLAVTVTTSCTHASEPAKAEPGAPAGKVVEISGAVTASRDGAVHPLVVGDTVSADDVIATGADGRVSIVLEHNRARWELGPGKQTKVNESLAWALAKQEGSAAQVEQATSAAGRVAERSAAETAASTTHEEPPPPPKPSPPARSMAPGRPPAEEPAKKDAPPRRPPPPPPPPPAPPATGAVAPPAPQAAAPPTADPGAPPSLQPPAADDAKLGARGGGGGAIQADKNQQEVTSSPIQVLLEHERAALMKCLGESSLKLRLTLHVEHGVASTTITGGASNKIGDCMSHVVHQMKLGTLDGEATISLSRSP